MASRKKIGIFYFYNEGWIGGTYYIENLIHALNTLDEDVKPHIVLITNHRSDYKKAREKLIYPYISFQLGSGEKYNVQRFINKVTGRLFNIKIFPQAIKALDAVFPYYKSVQQSLAKKKIYWIADFQELFASEFFDPEMIEARKRSHLEIESSSENLILSSHNAFQHFKSLYPKHKVQVSILPFAVTHPDYNSVVIENLQIKFGLAGPYFICPNQFWKHKNQIVVLEALNHLKSIEHISFTIVFTGNTEDHRNPDYFKGLEKFVEDHSLGNYIKFLGFIDRKEQLQLMNNSLAIIQPSFFEGWSTVVEDAKSMNKALIVSDIDIHREQLINTTAIFFNPADYKSLSVALSGVCQMPAIPALFGQHQYDRNIQMFAQCFLRIVSE